MPNIAANIAAHNDEFLKNGNNNRANLKHYKNCEFKPINLKTGTENRPVILDFPPDPLHIIIPYTY